MLSGRSHPKEAFSGSRDPILEVRTRGKTSNIIVLPSAALLQNQFHRRRDSFLLTSVISISNFSTHQQLLLHAPVDFVSVKFTK